LSLYTILPGLKGLFLFPTGFRLLHDFFGRLSRPFGERLEVPVTSSTLHLRNKVFTRRRLVGVLLRSLCNEVNRLLEGVNLLHGVNLHRLVLNLPGEEAVLIREVFDDLAGVGKSVIPLSPGVRIPDNPPGEGGSVPCGIIPEEDRQRTLLPLSGGADGGKVLLADSACQRLDKKSVSRARSSKPFAVSSVISLIASMTDFATAAGTPRRSSRMSSADRSRSSAPEGSTIF